MKHFIKKMGKSLIICAVACIPCLSNAYAVGDVSYISGMYRSGLDPELYSPYWQKTENEAETVIRGIFRGHEIRFTKTRDDKTSVSSSESILSLIFDFIHNKNLERYDLSEDEKAYLAISFYYVLKSLDLGYTL